MKKNPIKNPGFRLVTALVLSVLLTVSVFLGGIAVVMGELGAYTGSYKMVTEGILANEAASLGWQFADKYGIYENDAKAFKDFEENEENVDYVIKNSKGKKLYSSWDKKAVYIAKEQVNINYDENGNYLELTAYIKESYYPQPFLKLLAHMYDARYRIIAECVALLLLSIGLGIRLMSGAGKRPDDDEIHLRRFDKVPADLYFMGAGLTITGLIAIGVAVMDQSIAAGLIVSFLLGILCVIIFTAFMMCMAVQVKKQILLKGTLIGRLCLAIASGIRAIPYVWKTVLIASVLAIINFVIIGCNMYSGGAALLILEVIAAVAFIWYLAVTWNRVKTGGEKIAAGDTGVDIKTKNMLPEMKKHAENINSINEAIVKAVDERMRSEMFKTELITNVSHDIKTPLTSIINYTELLKERELEDETAREYVETISKHAEKLKKLTMDIVDASKASTGNVKVEIGRLSAGTMAIQAAGEYREKFENAGLIPVISVPDDDVTVFADGRHMGRVLDNVLSNINKYAQPGTRVYIDVKKQGDKVLFVFKNISGQQLNISSDDLMERFVRGDSSRNTEGSGLGLSIAKSLTQLQGGTFDIDIDGDLFKVTIAMRAASFEEEE